MTGRAGKTIRSIVPEAIADALDASAEAADLDLGVLASAVLVGAVRKGQVDRLLDAGLDAIPHKRRTRTPLPWVRDDDPATTRSVGQGQPEAGTWRYPHPAGDWTMVRLGNPGNSRYPGPEDGWYLEGPGLADPLNVGLRRDDAIAASDVVIRGWLRRLGDSRPLHPTEMNP